MSEKITKELYKGEVKIDFYPESHRYKKVGEKTYLISATAVTGIIDKSRFLIPWAVGLASTYIKSYLENSKALQFTTEELLPIIDEACQQHTIKKEQAADIGSQVHDWAMKFGMAKLGLCEAPELTDEMDEKVVLGINAFLDWYNNNKVEFLETEKMVYSRQYGFVGITDLVAKVNDKKLIIDYKTGKGIYSEYNYQVAGYRGAYEEEHGKVNGGLILHFSKETGEFSTKELTDEDHEKDYKVFLSLLTVKLREKELAKS